MFDCLPYFFVFALVFIINCIGVRQKRVWLRKFFIIFGFLFLVFFIGFRYDVGTDYNNYLEIFERTADASFEKIFASDIEPFVSILFKVSSLFLLDARLIFLILGFLTLWPIYRVNKIYDYKYLPYSVLSYSILFLPFGLNGIRQGIAAGFALLSFVFLNEDKKKNATFYFLVAVLFHASSLVVLPYLIAIIVAKRKKINFTWLNIIITGSVSVIVLFFLKDILSQAGFSQYNYILNDIDIDSISLVSVVVYIPILVLPFCFQTSKDKTNNINILRNLMISGALFTIVGSAAQYLSRFGLYFLMPSILLLPHTVQSISNKNTRVLIKCLLIIYFILFFYLQYSLLGKHEILPYQTWLFGGL